MAYIKGDLTGGRQGQSITRLASQIDTQPWNTQKKKKIKNRVKMEKLYTIQPGERCSAGPQAVLTLTSLDFFPFNMMFTPRTNISCNSWILKTPQPFICFKALDTF